jgi:hypothetical protein
MSALSDLVARSVSPATNESSAPVAQHDASQWRQQTSLGLNQSTFAGAHQHLIAVLSVA